MLKKLIVSGLLSCILSVFTLGAANVSFMVLETGLPAGSPANPYSATWENALMDVFFEMGHIVSNAPRMRLAEKPAEVFPYEAERDFDSAIEGGMDYFVIALIDHNRPRTVSLRLFNTKSQQMLQEQIFEDRRFSTSREEHENIKMAIESLAVFLGR